MEAVIPLFLFPRSGLLSDHPLAMSYVCVFCMYVSVSVFMLCGAISESGSPSYGERGSDLGLRVFLKVVQEKPQENVVLSPHGVASILGMLLPGAHGNTKRQLISGLQYKKKGV